MEYILPHWKPPFDLSPAVTRLVQPLLGSVWMGWRGEGRAGRDWLGWGGQPLYGSFDHLIGSNQQRRRDGQAERLGGLEIDGELEFSRLLHWQIGRARAFENFVHVHRCLPPLIAIVGPVCDKSAALYVTVWKREHRRKAITQEFGDLGAVIQGDDTW